MKVVVEAEASKAIISLSAVSRATSIPAFSPQRVNEVGGRVYFTR